jgi:hypothetical protein|tara:strand:+ start:539 stop:1564 length:1026 start_codon:yes stop_codon:yes gene_type:complete
MERLKEIISQLRVVSIGHITHDRYNQECMAGGSAFFGAKVASKLGCYSYLFSAVGEDFIFDHLIDDLQTYIVRAGKTTTFTNLYPLNHPRIQWIEAQASMLYPHDFPIHWFTNPHPSQKKTKLDNLLNNPPKDDSFGDNSSIDLLFLAPVLGELDPKDSWVNLIKPKFVSLCLQGFMRKVTPRRDLENQQLTFACQTQLDSQAKKLGSMVIPLETDLPCSLFKGIDALFVSEEDIQFFGKQNTLTDLRKNVPLLFVTKGEHGCDIYEQGKQYHVDIYPTKVIDPTGAGDTFAMSTSLGLVAGLSSVEAAFFGCVVASIVIEDKGSIALDRIGESYKRYLSL